MKPYSGIEPGRITIIDLPKLEYPKRKSPIQKEKKVPPTKYTGPIKLGNCVKIVDTITQKLEGPILRADDIGFDIVTLDGVVHKNVTYQSVEASWNIAKGGVPKEFLDGNRSAHAVAINGKQYVVDISKKPDIAFWRGEAITKYPFVYGIFEREVEEELKGIVVDYADDGFVIKLGEDDPLNSGTNLIEVDYDDDSLKHCVPLDDLESLKKSSLRAEDYLKLPVDFNTRRQITKLAFKILSGFIPDLYDSDVYQNPKVVELAKNINWNVLNFPMKSWDYYYEENVRMWYFTKMHNELIHKAPDFTKEALSQYENSMNPLSIINELMGKFGNIFDGDGENLLFLMNEASEKPDFQPSIIDVIIRQELTRLGGESDLIGVHHQYHKEKGKKGVELSNIVKIPEREGYLKKLKGKRLAVELSSLIASIIREHPPPNVSQLKSIMVNKWVNDQVINHTFTKKERKEYDDEYLKTLKVNYDVQSIQFDTEKAKYDEYEIIVSELKKKSEELAKIQQGSHRLQSISIDGKQLSSKGILVADDLQMLEEKIFIETEGGKTNEAYLQKFVRILMFLDHEDIIGRITFSLRSKVATSYNTSGEGMNMYSIAYLDSLDFTDVLPELYVNSKIDQKERINLAKKLKKEVHVRVLELIDIFILKTPPPLGNDKSVNWEQYLQPLSKSCGDVLRIKKDVKYRGEKDIENYDCNIVEKGSSKKVCKAKVQTEKTPEEDLIIYYDEQSGRFICLSLTDTLYAIKDREMGRDPINHITGVTYSREFLDRMYKRYGTFLKSINSLGDRVMSFSLGSTLSKGDKRVKALPKIPPKVVKEKSPVKEISEKSVKKSKTLKSKGQRFKIPKLFESNQDDPPNFSKKNILDHAGKLGVSLTYGITEVINKETIKISNDVTFYVEDGYMISKNGQYSLQDLARGLYYAYQNSDVKDDSYLIHDIIYSGKSITDESDS